MMNIKLFATLTAISTAAILVAERPATAYDFTATSPGAVSLTTNLNGTANNHGITFINGGTSDSTYGLVSSETGATTINLNNGFPTTGEATFTGYNSTSLVQGSLVGQYGDPTGDTAKFLAISPTNDKVAGNTGSVTIDFATAINYFGLYWGSADNYNQISFYNGSTLLGEFGGSQIAGDANGSWTSSDANFYANFLAGSVGFTSVELSATGVAFESGNYAYTEAVPEPATILGTLAFGAFAAARKRKQQTQA